MGTPSPTDPNGKYAVFLSHKVKDEHVTRSIIDLLDSHTENVRYFLSENIANGDDWRECILKQLNLSKFFVLVFTDPDEDWGWCLYETGFFDALTQIPDPTRHIYCLHHASTSPPPPIANLQTIPATVERISAWLTGFFRETTQTKQKFLDDIPQIAAQICELFARERKPIYLAKSVNVAVPCSSLKSPNDLPDETTIDGEKLLMQELFGTNNGRIDWRSAKERFAKFPDTSEANFNAVKEISRALYAIYKNDRVLPVQGTIFVGQGPKRYRPVLSCAKELSLEKIGCEILLIEEVGGPLQNVDKQLGALLTSIRMAIRIRWEVVHPFASNIQRLARDARKLRFDLQTCFNNIFMEAEFRGNFSPDDVVGAFERREEQSIIEGMIEEWDHTYRKLWESIGFKDVTYTFGEVSDQPLTEQEITLLEAGMRELAKMNRDFLKMAVARAEALVQREIRITGTPSALHAIAARSHTRNKKRAQNGAAKGANYTTSLSVG